MKALLRWTVKVPAKTDEPTTRGEYASRAEAEEAAKAAGGKAVRVKVLR